MLTQQQSKLLTFVDGFIRERGYSPSFEEMAAAIDLKSKSGIHRLLTGLEERQFIRRIPGRPRGMRVLRRLTSETDLAMEALAILKLRKRAREASAAEFPTVNAALIAAEEAALAKLGEA